MGDGWTRREWKLDVGLLVEATARARVGRAVAHWAESKAHTGHSGHSERSGVNRSGTCSK